jgi:Ni/Co efflux regulator RcnB
MKKLMTSLLALSFLATTATLTFAADDKKPADDKKTTATKAKGKKKHVKKPATTETKTTPK